MDIEPFKTSKEFLGLFDFSDSLYKNVITFSDKQIGFSVKRQYPQDIKFKPAKTLKGDNDTVALIRISYGHPERINAPFNPEKVPIFIDICKYSIYGSNRFGYNYKGVYASYYLLNYT
jgi:hypothetical protein